MSSFDVEKNGGYSRDRYYTHSTDQHGHKTTVRANVPPDMMRRIAIIVASRAIPEYGTSSDFVRDAVFHRLHEVGEKIADIDTTRTVDMAAALDDLRAYDAREQEELEIAKTLDRRLYENRSAFTADDVSRYVSGAQTERGKREISVVYVRYFG